MFLHIFPKIRAVKIASSQRLPELRAVIGLEARGDRNHLPQKFGDAVTAGHNLLSEENESRLQHRDAVAVQNVPNENLNCAGIDDHFEEVPAARSETKY